jgi:hypothetical protein
MVFPLGAAAMLEALPRMVGYSGRLLTYLHLIRSRTLMQIVPRAYFCPQVTGFFRPIMYACRFTNMD